MRGREFLMKDAYSIDLNQEEAVASYHKMMRAYIKTFRRMGLTAVPVRADTGPIGGDLSHEFHIVAKTGESALYYDERLETLMAQQGDVDVEEVMNIYAAADELHDAANCPVSADKLKQARGIEIGHVFYFGTKYSESMKLSITGKDGTPVIPHMGSYGIGVSRLVAAVIEASHDDAGIIWPESIAPFHIGLVNINIEHEGCREACDQIYAHFTGQGIDVLYDERDERPGVKLAEMDLIGLPWQVRVGPKGLDNGQIELKNRKSGEVTTMTVDDLLNQFKISKVA